MRMLSLFSGIGGIDLAAEWAGIETAAFCEIEPFCQKVLKKHWPDVPIFGDIKKLNRQALIEKGVIDSGQSIDIIAGGWPCQPFSDVGQRKGKEDERHLWPEVNRLVRELKPRWVVGENVNGFNNKALDDTLYDMEEQGYTCKTYSIPANVFGAPDERYRTFIVCYANSITEPQANKGISTVRSSRQAWENTSRINRGKTPGVYWETHQSPICGVDNGLSERFYKDRMKALGNAVKPQQIYPIFEAIMKIEKSA